MAMVLLEPVPVCGRAVLFLHVLILWCVLFIDCERLQKLHDTTTYG